MKKKEKSSVLAYSALYEESIKHSSKQRAPNNTIL